MWIITFQRHMAMLIGGGPYKHKQCGIVFRHHCTFQSHGETHTGEKFYKYKQCGKAFNSYQVFQIHEKITRKIKPMNVNVVKPSFITVP